MAWMSTVTDDWRPAAHSYDTRMVAVTVLSLDTGANAASVVGFRYLGTGKDLTLPRLEEILGTVRQQITD